MRYNLYTNNSEMANQYLVMEFGPSCAETFGVPRKKGSATVYVASWNVDDSNLDMIDGIERGIVYGLFDKVESFDDFGYVDSGV